MFSGIDATIILNACLYYIFPDLFFCVPFMVDIISLILIFNSCQEVWKIIEDLLCPPYLTSSYPHLENALSWSLTCL